MRWTAPPEKREIALVLVSLIVYFVAYNFEMSMDFLGIDPVATQRVVFSGFGLGNTQVIGKDGRKPPGWRDALEADVYGDWEWDEGHIALDNLQRSHPKGSGRHGASWIGKADTSERLSELTVNDALQRWGGDIPQTQLLKHAPGYTILDKVYIFNGSVYLVTDNEQVFPPISSIFASRGEGLNNCTVLSSEKARELLGSHGATIRGVSWLSADTKPDNSTLFALWRTYSSLDPSIDSAGRTKLAPPHRLLFPNTHAFSDPKPPNEEHWRKLSRANIGFHPYLAKAAFPQLTLQYLEDWNDYQKMATPFVFERLVIADRSATQGAIVAGQPVYSPAFDLEGASSHWWEPVRTNLATYLGEHESKPGAQKVVTYIHTQGESQGAKLLDRDHESISRALNKMGQKYGYEVHVVSTQTNQTDWVTKMTAVVKSSIILGVHGNHLMDSVFMQPSPQSTVIELFPTNKFSRDREFVIHARGLRYMAWWENQSYATDLPPISPPNDEPVLIDSQALVQTIHDLLSRDI
ncbi:hypothetical protein BYT27DRAFT_7199682 [Phlegmacium glaucopus]|nr:hypothetical protein BYT27DRAFT_7199682 [Phlegmacium glaucopus]